MLSDPVERSKLELLNMPVVEIGKTSLSGTDGNLSVNLNDVTFFAYAIEKPPAVWATGDAGGTFTNTNEVVEGATAVTLSSPEFDNNVDFQVQRWGGAAESNWGALVDSQPGTSGVVGGHAIEIHGGAAGTIDTVAPDLSGTFSGDGSGSAVPVMTRP
jgi:hypothetical protein